MARVSRSAPQATARAAATHARRVRCAAPKSASAQSMSRPFAMVCAPIPRTTNTTAASAVTPAEALNSAKAACASARKPTSTRAPAHASRSTLAAPTRADDHQALATRTARGSKRRPVFSPRPTFAWPGSSSPRRSAPHGRLGPCPRTALTGPHRDVTLAPAPPAAAPLAPPRAAAAPPRTPTSPRSSSPSNRHASSAQNPAAVVSAVATTSDPCSSRARDQRVG